MKEPIFVICSIYQARECHYEKNGCSWMGPFIEGSTHSAWKRGFVYSCNQGIAELVEVGSNIKVDDGLFEI